MRVLQLIYESFGSPFGFGGAGVRAYEIYKRLKERHEITLLCMKYPGARDGYVEGLNHLFVGTEIASLTRSVLAYTAAAVGYVKKYGNDFDVIVENFLPSTPFFTGLLTRTPVVLQVQGIMEMHALRKFSPLYALPMFISERFYPRLYRTFIFVSPVTEEKLMGRIGRSHRVSSVIPNGISEDLLRVKPEEGDYLLFFSRIDRYTKGLDLLVNAFEQVMPRHRDIRLILAGYEFDSFERLVTGCSAGTRERTEYAGFVSGAGKVRLLSGAKLFILPSRHESSPISILEAAACGKPVIVSDIPELRFVEEEGFGLTFPSGSAEGLAERIETLLNDAQLRRRLGERGRAFSSKFRWEDIALQFEDVLKGQLRWHRCPK